jgi:hypothetical protein
MSKLVNRAKMTTATTGTGTLTLGSAVDGYQSFAAAGVSDGDSVSYAIEDGSNWEIGTGIYSSTGPTLTRSVSESSNADAAIALSGDAVVYVTARGEDILSPEGDQTLTGGFNVTPFANGTRSSGTLTPDPLNGNIQTAVNGGAHTLAPPATSCTMVIQYTNNASAGTITVSGFTQVTGDDLTTTNGHDFLFFVTKIGSFSLLDVRALQ